MTKPVLRKTKVKKVYSAKQTPQQKTKKNSAIKKHLSENDVNTKKQQPKLTEKHNFFHKTPSVTKSHRNSSVLKRLGITNMRPKDYIASPFDKVDLVQVKPVHILECINGSGLFAREFIPANTCIGEYTGEWIKNTVISPDYSLVAGDHVVDAKVKGNFTRYINFSDSQSNCEFQAKKHAKQCLGIVTTLKDIYPGQQLLVDYNTFTEEDSRDYYFLNPQDNELAPIDWYQQEQENYLLVEASSLANSGITSASRCYATPLGEIILKNQSISRQKKKDLSGFVHHPYLPIDQNQLEAAPTAHIYSAGERDIFFPLMVASYLGQVNNVDWLLEHKANVDHQQHHSGNCPLFLALVGYERAKTGALRKNYFTIIRKLMDAGANLTIHDRNDDTFLHKSIHILSDIDFTTLIAAYAQQKSKDAIIPIFKYINNRSEDLIISCLIHRSWTKLSCLLSLYPEYFYAEYESALHSKQSDPSDLKILGLLKSILQSFDFHHERVAFFTCLDKAKTSWDQSLTAALLDNKIDNDYVDSREPSTYDSGIEHH